MTKLEHDSLLAIIWFENNYMKLNEEKCHLFVSGLIWTFISVKTYLDIYLCQDIFGHLFVSGHIWTKIGNSIIWEERIIKLLGINIDSKLVIAYAKCALILRMTII